MREHPSETLIHPFEPVYAPGSRVLILGSFPSAASRRDGFYYGHPRNRFWQILSRLFSVPVPVSADEKKALILDHRLALWDSIKCCDITLSADSSIRSPVPNDISAVLEKADIRAVFCNGRESLRTYDRYILPDTFVAAKYLPSSSPANAAWTLDKLIDTWREILTYL